MNTEPRLDYRAATPELAALNLAVVTTNAWNRFGIAFHVVPQP